MASLQKPRLLICGATGFIGRNITTALAQNGDYEITAVYHHRPAYPCQGVQWFEADLTRTEDVERVVADQDIIIQAAAATSGSKVITSTPWVHVTDNAVMNSLLLRSAFAHAIQHFVFFSCTIMYASSPTTQSEADFDPARELEPKYFGAGWTKLYVERMCEFYARQGRTRHTVIRHSNVYGPHDKFDLETSHVLGATITKALTATDRLTLWGNGEETRDFLYIDDLTRFVEAAITRQTAPFGLYNVAGGRSVSINDAARAILAAAHRNLPLDHDLSAPTIPVSIHLDCTKAAQDLGWAPQVSLEDGLTRTVAWWRDNITPKSNGNGPAA
ncbi:MAG: NAD(P)-dependent oxidoreductase [Rhodospirillaceae bacterium]|nr:NAD(P)-dependent oxidoreductase [Rhodospirillaceae bacterium]